MTKESKPAPITPDFSRIMTGGVCMPESVIAAPPVNFVPVPPSPEKK